MLIEEDWYHTMVEECNSIMTEAVYSAREIILKAHWLVGKELREHADKVDGISKMVSIAANDIELSERSLWYSVKFFDEFEDFQEIYQLPEGKNLSWSKMKKEYLTEAREEPEKDEVESDILAPLKKTSWYRAHFEEDIVALVDRVKDRAVDAVRSSQSIDEAIDKLRRL